MNESAGEIVRQRSEGSENKSLNQKIDGVGSESGTGREIKCDVERMLLKTQVQA